MHHPEVIPTGISHIPNIPHACRQQEAVGQWPMHCIQHQGSAKGWGSKPAQLLWKKTPAFIGKKNKKNPGWWCVLCNPDKRCWSNPSSKAGGEKGFAQKGCPHPAAGASGNPGWWESSQLLSCREEAAAHRVQQLRRGRV